MSELHKPRESLSPEQIKANLEAYLNSVANTVIERGSENIKINLVFFAEAGVQIICYFNDQRKIESHSRYFETDDPISHDKSNPLAAISLSAVIGNSNNYLQLLASDTKHKDERTAKINLSNPEILNNITFDIEKS